MRQDWSPGVVLAWVLCASVAVAGPDTWGLGTGRDGTLRITKPRTVINHFAQLKAPLAPGDAVLAVSTTEGFAAGDLIMVLQTTGIVPEPARGDPGPIQLSHDPVGRWELARVSAASIQELKLAAPLLYSYAGLVTQIIRVPEYTDVTIEPGASITTVPWDGSKGGVLAFLARGLIQNEGELQASGMGFRGGVAPEEFAGFAGCAALPAAVRPGAGRGEGITFQDFGVWATGLENASNGGGGGLCPQAGGGGGGNGAAGGRGGDSTTDGDSAQQLGGKGGAVLLYSLMDHLSLGGGGGQGYGGGRHSQGGVGGGAIFIRAQRLAGRGSILANGSVGEDATQGGAGGGGAGGSISLRIADTADCELLAARGGSGGRSTPELMEYAGSGGGGGGGRVLYQAARAGACPISVEAGLAGGLTGPIIRIDSGAQPTALQLSTHRGVITRLETGFEPNLACALSAPVFTRPLEGQSVNARPTISGSLGADYQNGDDIKITVGSNAAASAAIDRARNTWSYTHTSPDLVHGTTYLIQAVGVCNGNGGNSSNLATVSVKADTQIPQLTWVMTPPSPSPSTTATFTFGATNEDRPLTFTCKLDSQPEYVCGVGGHVGVLTATLNGLAEGPHTFTAAAVDEAGNASAGALRHDWTVTLPADTFIDPPVPANPTNRQTATFTFRSSKTGSTFQCRLDGSPWGACTSPKAYTESDLAAGPHQFEVRAIISGPIEDPSPAVYSWRIDLTPPDTLLTGTPSSPSNNPRPTFIFSSTEPGGSFDCDVDGTSYQGCASPWIVPVSLAHGNHRFTVRARDAAGNQDTVGESYSWAVDLIAPDTQITGAPSSSSNDRLPSFTFTSTEAGSTFECILDGASHPSCLSPWTVTAALDEGPHRFTVKATDAAGNPDPTAATHDWRVDLTPPDTLLTGAPTSPSNNPRPIFTFNSTESGSTFDCDVDGTPYQNCVSPWTVPVALGENSHTFSVKARDAAGNQDASAATHSWAIDLTAPDTRLTGTPSDPSNNPRPTFIFSSTEAGSTFECVLDGNVHQNCVSPWIVPTNLVESRHSFSVKARDAAGNQDASAASYSWDVDLTAPDTLLTITPSNPSNSPSPPFSFRSTEVGSTFECKLDTLAYTSCTSPWTPPEPLLEGSHRFMVRATDPAGNVDLTVASYDWRVDYTPPETQLTGTPTNPSNVPRPIFTFSSTEAGSNFTCVLDGTPYPSCVSPWTVPVALGEGRHNFSVKARDAASNQDLVGKSYSWDVDLTPPDTQLTEAPSSPSNNPSPTFAFTSTEAGSTFDCSVDGTTYSNCISPWTVPGQLRDGLHVFTVAARDAAGNQDFSPASHSWIVDTTGPDTRLTGTPSNPSNNRRPSFIFNSTAAGSTFECTLDGMVYQNCGSPWPVPGDLVEGDHHFSVTATDPAGNPDPDAATYDWRVDLTPPNTDWTSVPGSPTNNPRPTYTFTSTEVGSTFVCELDGVVYPSCTSPWIVPTQLAEGTHHISVTAKDAAGNADLTPAIHDLTVDTTAPDTRIDQKPDNPTNRTYADFVFSGAGTGGKYWCSLDSTTETSCDSGSQHYDNLSVGTHRFCVAAQDAAGNRDPFPECYTWIVDQTEPSTVIIEDSKPRNPTNVTTVTFRFSGAGTGGKYRCKLVPIDTDFYACDSGMSREYTGLVERGSSGYTFSVYSITAAGNDNSQRPATYTWVVDLSDPDTEIDETSKPTNPSNADAVTFVFNGAGEEGTYFCSLDQSTYVECKSGRVTYVPSNGAHTFSVYAADAAKNTDKTPAAYSWVVDRIKPVVKVTNPSVNTLTKVWRTNSLSPSFVGTTTEFPSKVEISIDDSSDIETVQAIVGGNWGLETAKSISAVGEATHTVKARATDAAANTGEWSDVVQFVVDQRPPDTKIVGTPRKVTNKVNVSFSFDAPDEPAELVTTYECKIVAHRIGKEFIGRCNKDQSYNLLTIFGLEGDSAKDVNGKYTIYAAAVDEAGNKDSTPDLFDFDVVADLPSAPKLTSPAQDEVVYDLRPTFSGTTVSDGQVKIVLGDKREWGTVANAQGQFSLTVPTPLEESTYEVQVMVTDVADNPSAYSDSIRFTVAAPKDQAHAIGGGLGCAASSVQPWLALLGLFIGSLLRSRKRRT